MAKREPITRRLRRLFFGQEETPKDDVVTTQAPKVEPSQPAPAASPECSSTIELFVLSDGTVHVNFKNDFWTRPPQVVVKDPITRKISRRVLKDGMRRTTAFYDAAGNLQDSSIIG